MRFGHLEFASVALGEAIRVAQQGGDKACVAHAMSWLHQVLAAQGHPRASDVLRRFVETRKDKMGKYELTEGIRIGLKDNSSPVAVFEIRLSSILRRYVTHITGGA